MTRLSRTLLVLGALSAGPALAHHSFSMFAMDKEVVMSGEVKDFQWTNPHIWIQLLVPGADGKTTEWSIEGTSPNVLSRQGWNKRSVKVGEKVTVTVHPLKDGTAGAALVKVVLADGKVVGEE